MSSLLSVAGRVREPLPLVAPTAGPLVADGRCRERSCEWLAAEVAPTPSASGLNPVPLSQLRWRSHVDGSSLELRRR